MNRRAGLALAWWLLFCGSCAVAAPEAAGRWQGQADIPGAPMPLVIDLLGGADKAWIGSAIVTRRGVKGAPLADIRVTEHGVQFSLVSAFGSDAASPCGADLLWHSDGSLRGEFFQAGLRAPLRLVRTGPAQVDLPAPHTALAQAMLGVWRGRYELGGYARAVTVTLAQGAQGLGAGEIIIVGKRRSVLPITRVAQGREFITLENGDSGVRIEGRWRMGAGGNDGQIDGHFVQGPFVAALVLRQASQINQTGAP